MSPSFVMYFVRYFGDKYGVRGSRFGIIFGRSKNVPKSIAIDQESLISDFGIIKTPKNHKNYFRNQENQQINKKNMPHFGPY